MSYVAWPAMGYVIGPGGFIGFGSDPGASGALRFTYGEIIASSEHSGGSARTLWDWGVVADTVRFGADVGTVHMRATSALVGVYNGAVRMFSVEATDTSIRTTNIGFYPGNTPGPKPSIAGSRGGNAALADLLTKLAAIGLLTDGTTA